MAKPVLCVSTSKIALNTYKLQQQGQIPVASYFNCASYLKKENSLEMIRTCLSATRIVNSFDKASNNEAFATYYLKQCMADRQYLPDVLAFDI